MIVYCGGRARFARPPVRFASRGFACRSPVGVRLCGVRLCGFACVGFGITIDQIPNRSQITIFRIDEVAVVVLASLALPCASPQGDSLAVRLWGCAYGGVGLCGFACVGSPEGAVTIFFFLATDGTAVRSLQACRTLDIKVGRKNIKTGRK